MERKCIVAPKLGLAETATVLHGNHTRGQIRDNTSFRLTHHNHTANETTKRSSARKAHLPENKHELVHRKTINGRLPIVAFQVKKGIFVISLKFTCRTFRRANIGFFLFHQQEE